MKMVEMKNDIIDNLYKDDEYNTYLYWIEDNLGQCIINEKKPNNSYIEDDIIHIIMKYVEH